MWAPLGRRKIRKVKPHIAESGTNSYEINSVLQQVPEGRGGMAFQKEVT